MYCNLQGNITAKFT